MEWLGGSAIVVAVLGFAVAGLVLVIAGVRDDRRRTVPSACAPATRAWPRCFSVPPSSSWPGSLKRWSFR